MICKEPFQIAISSAQELLVSTFISFNFSKKDFDEELGVEFEAAVFDGIRKCANNCYFCFVNMIAPDMRASLSIKDDDYSTTQNIIRETMKGFANPWTFNYGEVLDAYETAIEKDMLKDLEPHTTSLYFALGKRLWFSQCNSANVKVTTKQDLDIFEGHLLLMKKRANRKIVK